MIWIPAFVFLMNGLRRISTVMKKLHDYTMVEESFWLYAACAALAIIGEIPGIVIGFFDDYQSSPGYAACIIGENVLIFAYQFLLVIILYDLIRRAVQSKQRSKQEDNLIDRTLEMESDLPPADTTGNNDISAVQEDSLYDDSDRNQNNLLQALSGPLENIGDNYSSVEQDESWRMTNDAILKTLYGNIPNLNQN